MRQIVLCILLMFGHVAQQAPVFTSDGNIDQHAQQAPAFTSNRPIDQHAQSLLIYCAIAPTTNKGEQTK